MLPEFERLHGKPKRPGIHSQHDEQHAILAYFGDRVGRFLDVGACDGVSCSNTYALAQRGWSGVCVEPDPDALEALRQTHDGNPSIAIVSAALGERNGYVRFHTSHGGGVSTTSDAHRNKWKGAARFDTIEVPSINVETLLKLWPGPYEFVSVDCESTSADVLEMLPLADMGVELVCCEHDGKDQRVAEYCHKHGLAQTLYRSRENLVICR
jgi:FkbM family methyltransferase